MCTFWARIEPRSAIFAGRAGRAGGWGGPGAAGRGASCPLTAPIKAVWVIRRAPAEPITHTDADTGACGTKAPP
jgi:hypothetical protein